MTAKQLKAKAPFYWQAVEDAVYENCQRLIIPQKGDDLKKYSWAWRHKTCHTIAHNSAFIATSEFVSRSKK
jgi:hypothetical protein